MFCRKCGAEIKSGKFCPVCGIESSGAGGAISKEPAKTANDNGNNYVNNEANLEPVMSVWSYVGLFLLGMIPIIGNILIIVFALNNSNLNRRNYCRAIIVIWVVSALLIGLCWGAIGGMAYGLLYNL